MWVKQTAQRNTAKAGLLLSLQISKREQIALALCELAMLVCKHERKTQDANDINRQGSWIR